MAEIDDILSTSLKRVAPPGDATGVADAIRSRVDAGDTGTPAGSSGFGGGGPLSWLPWVGVVIVAGLVGGSLGPLGVFGANITEVTTAGTATVEQDAAAYLCVGGAEAAQLPAGQRVLAIARSEDSSWLGLRDPLNVAATIWVPVSAVTLDDGQDAAALPVGGACPVVETTLVVPQAPVTATPTPVPVAGDTTPPSIGQQTASPNPIHQTGFSPDKTTVTVIANDNVAVTSVVATWATNGPVTGKTVNMTKGGNFWSFEFGPYATPGPDYDIPITITAFDAAGNQSSVVVVVSLEYLLI